MPATNSKSVQIAVRVPHDVPDTAKDLAQRLQRVFGATGARFSQTSVLRLAIERGLADIAKDVAARECGAREGRL